MMTTKKIVALLLAMVMLIGAIPAGVYAKTVDCEYAEHTHDDACYKLMCETAEHEHKACDLSCEIEAHTHCHPLTCDIKEHKHNACDLSCELDAHAHCYAFVCELDEHKHNDDCAEKVASELVTDIDDLDFIVGVPQEFTFETKANDDAGVMVVGLSDFSDPDALAKLEYYEPNTDAWYDLNGAFGGGNGFPMADAASKFRATFAKAGEYTFTSVMKTVDGGEVLCSVEATAAVREYEHAELVTNIGDIDFVVGETVEFTFSTVANDDAGVMVYGGSDFGVAYEDKIATLEYKAGDQWIDMKGQNFGGAQGFPMTDATSTFRVKFTDDAAGEYSFVASMKKVADDSVLCDITVPFVVEAKAAPEIPEEPVTPEIDPNALCGKYEHKHTACDLSCKLYEHTHCHGDTCEKVEHEHKACDLSCKLEAHTHCYPATEVEEEVKLLNGMDITVTAPVLGAEVNRDYELDVDGDVEFTDIYIDWFFNAKSQDVDDENWEVVKGKFEADVYHALLMEFTMDNAELAEDAVITVNGEEALIIPNGANTFNVIYMFPPLSDEEIEDGGDDKDPTVEGYEFVCELEEHKHVACDLSCKIPEHTHCFSDKCDKVAHKHNACDLSCKLEEHEHCYIAEKSDEDEGDEEAVVLNKVTITIEAPAIGEKFAESIALVTDPANLVALSDVELFWFAQGETEDEWLLLEKDDVAEAGVVYGVDICIPVDGFELNKDLIATINGKEALVSPIEDDLYIGFIFEAIADEDEGDDEEVTAPTIIDGANGEWKDNSKDGLTFRSNADFADFLSVKVDGAEIEAKNYEAKEGSTIVALKNEYLKTLKAGEHTLAVVSKNGEATTKFTITHVHDIKKVEAKAATCTEKGVKEHYECACGKWFSDEKGATEIIDKTSLDIAAAGHKAADTWTISGTHHWKKCTVCKEPAADKIAHDFDETGKICKTCKYDTDNPKTGSESPVGMIVAIMVVSVLGMSAIAGYYVWDKKRK